MNARLPAFAVADKTDDCPHESPLSLSMAVTSAAQSAIHAIPLALFDERAMANIITTLSARLHESSWRHLEHASDADDRLLDVFQILENAAEAQEREA